ncbi:hypothetical protein A5630_21275 [Mycolicibacterium mucogenicum]|uniref:Uncharacterized protein n=1 Tax=Mycolicibacterium mucogenicum TaxID=56689 RepID=A0A1A3H3M4_MYCMU|nr:gamma-glutamyl-gamma-aminobutyrate hydrolase family protein [Mycolicibacterium mucogenicum]OBJ42241.1 hypothetical protein A5630_21275 [Mycolicibacterium mucogenicum]
MATESFSNIDLPSPLIGITGQERFGYEVDRLPPFVKPEPLEVYLAPYITSVIEAGGTPVLLSRRSNPAAVIARLDGVILAGGEDVDPRCYASTPTSHSTPFDPARDEFELALVTAAIEQRVPVLGICRGAQLINVARGGTLVAHLSASQGEAHSYGGYPGTHRSQRIQIEPHTTLFNIYGAKLGINSYHHQAVDALGNGLTRAAVALDGVTEAIEMTGRDVIGVQWHPEMFGADPLFSWLVSKAADGIVSAEKDEEVVESVTVGQ